MTSACVGILIRKEAGGDSGDAFAALVAGSQRRVFQIAYSVLGNAADAEEVAQEVFLRAHRKFGAVRDPEKFCAWVNRIAFREALNRQRAERRQMARDTAWHAAGPGAAGAGENDAEERLFLDRVRKEIDGLPEKLRAVLMLCAVEELEAGEVGQILKIPAGTVRSRLHLARKRLLGVLES